MSDILREIDQILNGSVHSVFVGRSAATSDVYEGDRKRFAVIRKGAGETVAQGYGPTAEHALRDAVNKMRRVPTTEPEEMVVRMPL